jgi:peptide deformylase
MVKPIIKFPKPSLRLRCKEVSFPLTPELSEHIRDLRHTLAATPNGIALASNQIATEGHRVFVVKPDVLVPAVATMQQRGMVKMPEIFINPKWEVYPPHEIDTHPYDWPEHAAFVEGCLSVPELAMPHVRQYWVEVEAQDEDGSRFVWIGRALGARIVQHECDHLDGKLLLDYADRKKQFQIRTEAINNRKKGR